MRDIRSILFVFVKVFETVFNPQIVLYDWPKLLNEAVLEKFFYLFRSVFSEQVSVLAYSFFSKSVKERLASVLARLFGIVAFVGEDKQGNRPNLSFGDFSQVVAI